MMNELYELCDHLRNDIRELNKKDDISPTELERAYKAVDIIKDIKTIEAMEDATNSYEYRDGGQSNRMPYPNYYYDEPGPGYNNSYRRGRDSMGRYTSRDGGYGQNGDRERM